MQRAGVYRITNTKTGRAYVGSAVHLIMRQRSHFSMLRKGKHPNIHLQRSYSKWGNDAFKFDILEYVEDIKLLTEREQFYIDSYGLENLYNLRLVADSNLGLVWSEEVRAKMGAARIGNKNSLGSKSRLGQKNSPETRAKISASKIGKLGHKHTEDTKIKMRVAQKGKIVTDETRAKISAAKKGIRVTDETRARLSASKKGYQWSDESRKKLSVSKMGTKHTEETLAKLKGRVTSEEAKAKLRAIRLGSKQSPESLAKRAVTIKERDSAFKKTVCQFNTKTGEVISIFKSLTAASKQTSINLSCISEVCHGKQKTAGGYGWRFLQVDS